MIVNWCFAGLMQNKLLKDTIFLQIVKKYEINLQEKSILKKLMLKKSLKFYKKQILLKFSSFLSKINIFYYKEK